MKFKGVKKFHLIMSSLLYILVMFFGIAHLLEYTASPTDYSILLLIYIHLLAVIGILFLIYYFAKREEREATIMAALNIVPLVILYLLFLNLREYWIYINGAAGEVSSMIIVATISLSCLLFLGFNLYLYRSGKKKPTPMKESVSLLVFIAIFLLIGIVLWHLGILGGGGCGCNTARGFGRVKVMEPSILYVGDKLNFTIMNGVGATIHDLTITPRGSFCTPPEGVISRLGAGTTQQVSLTCFPKGKDASFRVYLTINYTEIVDDAAVPTSETGEIRGYAQPA